MAAKREIDWLRNTALSIELKYPETAECAHHLTERLSLLLLERLPPHLAHTLITLLPKRTDYRVLIGCAESRCDSSIGFPMFVECTRHILGLTDLLDSPRFEYSEDEYARFCEDVACAYLWAVAQDIPAEIKSQMVEELPSDLRSRINLYNGLSDRSKVA